MLIFHMKHVSFLLFHLSGKLSEIMEGGRWKGVLCSRRKHEVRNADSGTITVTCWPRGDRNVFRDEQSMYSGQKQLRPP